MNDAIKSLAQKKRAALSPGIFAGVLLAVTVLGVAVIVFFFNPATHGFYPACLFHALTGMYCPGCGMTRSVYALLHGNLRLALKDNALFVLTLPVLAVWGGRNLQRKLKNQPFDFVVPPKLLWLFVGTAILFVVVRNLPGYAWLTP